MSDVIVTIPGATDLVTQEGAPSSVIVYFPASNSVVTTVIDRGVLYGIQGAQGPQGPTGATGPQGPKGDTGAGVATGGTAGQVLQKSSSVDYATEWHTLVKADVGLGNVDNTSDANKPISTAVGLALADKADKATTLTVNGTAYDLSANRSWSVGDLLSTGSYANPTWLTSLAWGKITSTPTTLSGYGITDGVSTSGSYSNPSWITDLAFSKITGYSVPTLAQVTTAGNTTTNLITVGGLTANGSITASGALARGNYINNTLVASANNDVLVGLDINPTFTNGAFTGVVNALMRLSGLGPSMTMTSLTSDAFAFKSSGPIRLEAQNIAVFYGSTTESSVLARSTSAIIKLANQTTTYFQLYGSTGNVVLQNGGTFTDAGFRLDVNGTARIQNQLTTTGTITAASGNAYGVRINPTLAAAANNDILVALDLTPTYSPGSFTGVRNVSLRVANGSQIINAANGLYNIYIASSETTINAPSSSGILGFQINSTNLGRVFNTGNWLLQNGGTFTDAGYRLDVNGTARVQGNMSVVFTGGYNITMGNTGIDMNVSSARIYSSPGASLSYFNGTSVVAALTWNNSGNILINAGNDNSAILNVGSTTKGFLPPRMTTTQKNAITSPTSGLVVYDTTLGKLCVRGASAWETITSV